MRKHLLFTTILLAGMILPAQAQNRPRVRVEGRDGQARIFINGREMPVDQIREILFRRARLGVTVDLEASANDSIGASIVAVTPGGPAAKAGVRTGDIITRLNGEALGVRGTLPDGEESEPAARLIELAAKLEPNDTVTVEYMRDGQRTTATLITGDEPAFALRGDSFSFRSPEGGTRLFAMPELRMRRLFPDGPDPITIYGDPPGGGKVEVLVREFRGALGNLELAPLNPDLAPYFGTVDGVLVIQAPEDSKLGLKGGDVILSIDGRKPSSPANLMRILRTYGPDESIRFEVMRLKKRETITGTIGR